jgi:hypothetical protein
MSERGPAEPRPGDAEGLRAARANPALRRQQVWASPLLYDGKLYCKGRDEFVCLDVGGGK